MPMIFAQDINDALRYGNGEIIGSARYRALSGAFGALGGDLSAVNINPASSAVFSNSTASFTLGILNIDNDIAFFDGRNSNSDSDISIQQGGGAFVFKNRNENSKWKKFALSIAYDNTKNYQDNWSANGNGQNSISDYFIGISENQDIPFGIIKLQPGEFLEEAYSDIGANFGFASQQVFLGYWAGIIDPADTDDLTNDDNLIYTSNTEPANSFSKSNSLISSGYNGKLAFNASTLYNNKLYLGINLNSHLINYQRFTRYTENNSNNATPVNSLAFENRLTTNGNGFSFQLGAILKLTNSLRTGLTYDSPTWITIEEELIQGINSNFADQDINFISDIVNIFPTYRLQTPSKISGSLAYIFGSNGLLSFDYSIKDYSKTKFKPTSDAYFSQQNNIISNDLKAASTYKIGGEYKLKQLSLRAGYRFEESPYKNETIIGDLSGYSLGLGYKFRNTTIDLTYDQSKQSRSNQLFSTGLTDSAAIDRDNSNISLSLAFQL